MFFKKDNTLGCFRVAALTEKSNSNIYYDKNFDKVIILEKYLQEKNNPSEESITAVGNMLTLIIKEFEDFFIANFDEKDENKKKYFSQFEKIKNEIKVIEKRILFENIDMLLLVLGSIKDFFSLKESFFSEFVMNTIDYSIFENTLGKREKICKNFGIPNAFYLPLYSKSGALGFNTILYTFLFLDYLPVGFSLSPYPAHDNDQGGSCVGASWHDYRHASVLIEMKKNSEKTVEVYKEIYKEIFTNKINNETDDLQFKKDLLFLFILVFEIAFNLEIHENILEKIKNKFICNESAFMTDKWKQCDELNQQCLFHTAILATADLRLPLNALGYVIPSPTMENYNDYVFSLESALKDLYSSFIMRYEPISRYENMLTPQKLEC